MGYSLVEEVAEFSTLRTSVLRLWLARGPAPEVTDAPPNSATPPAIDAVELIRFNEAIDQVLAESMELYSAEKEQRNRLFDTLLSSSPDLNFIFGLDGWFLYASEGIGRS